MNTQTIHQLIRIFVGYGSPDLGKDDTGANKADYPFFNRVANASMMEDHDLLEAAERLHKYRNTQFTHILKDAGFTKESKDVLTFISDMKKKGEVAKVAYEKEQVRVSKLMRKRNLAENNIREDLRQRVDVVIDEHITAIMEAFSIDKATATQQVQDIVSQWKPPAHLTVSLSVIEDKWSNRWGKQFITSRIALDYHYNTSWNSALKAGIQFPKLKFSGDIKKWTIANELPVLEQVVDILDSEGAFFDASLASLRGENAFTAPTPAPVQRKGVEATLQGTSIVLAWPYIPDPIVRNILMGEIKSTQGRKYNPDTKTWSISIYEASPLIDRLRSIEGCEWATKLAEAIANIPEVFSVMEERAKRIAISSAATLEDDDSIEHLREYLSESFPTGMELYPFQYVGVQFAQLANGRCLIGDDMGIGKTIQAIAHIAVSNEKLPALVICPASVKYNWLKECKAWLPDYRSVALKGRTGTIPDADIVIINYDIVSGRLQSLLDYDFNIVVCDESHYLKNSKAKRTQATLEVAKQSDHILCLSGTAITNRPNEFYTTLNLLRPNEFNSFFEYGKRYCDGYEKEIGWGKTAWDFSGASNTTELHQRTRDFTIRRLKSEVLTELPDKVRQILSIDATTAEKKQYKDLHRSWMDEYHSHCEEGTLPQGFMLNMLTDLRHECGKIKVKAAIEYIKNYREITGKPIVVFAHHKDVLKGISKGLRADKDYQWRITAVVGGMPAETRQENVEKFQAGKSDVILCSTIAAKEGITLTMADTTLFVEREWVPGWEEQAEDRVHRIGQDSQSVSAVYLSIENTIDSHFNIVIEEKRKVLKAVLDGGDLEDREGIANMLIQKMIASGDLPADFMKEVKAMNYRRKE